LCLKEMVIIMKRELTCIICPRGCQLSVDINKENTEVTGNACPKGKQYAIDECTNPTRTVTTTVRVSNREDTMVSVKTATPVSKKDIFKVMEKIREISVIAPVKIGDVIIKNLCGADIIATKNID